MCGIFAYAGDQLAIPFLLSGLQKLEYRGYDSAGLVAFGRYKEKPIFYEQKALGKVSNLANQVLENSASQAPLFQGIAHTRWATHGKVTLENTHPHFSQNGRFVLVHNGIIENYWEIKKLLQEHGYIFAGETDSEILVNFIEYHFETDLQTTLKKVKPLITGAYALVVVDKELPDTMIGMKLGSPLVLGIGKNRLFLSSDSNALLGETDTYIPLDDHDMVVIQAGKYTILSSNTTPKAVFVSETQEHDTYRGEFAHAMQKEIFEIPLLLENILWGRVDFEKNDIFSATLASLELQNIQKIELIASGTSYHAALEAVYLFEELANIPTTAHIASEYKYQKHFVDSGTLFMFLSQSWETADTLECAKIISARWGKTFGVVNVVGSSIARVCQTGWYTHCGVEIGVAATKTFIGQLVSVYVFALYMGKKKWLAHQDFTTRIRELSTLSDMISHVLLYAPNIQKIAKKYAHSSHMFFLGRNMFFPIALEGNLKCKEITYMHTEAYPAGELKHGPLSLIDADFPTLLVNPYSDLHEKNISTLNEIQSRSGKVIGLVSEHDACLDIYDDVIVITKTSEYISLFTASVALQLFAYYMAVELWREIDTPRNLAKSVTVE